MPKVTRQRLSKLPATTQDALNGSFASRKPQLPINPSLQKTRALTNLPHVRPLSVRTTRAASRSKLDGHNASTPALTPVDQLKAKVSAALYRQTVRHGAATSTQGMDQSMTPQPLMSRSLKPQPLKPQSRKPQPSSQFPISRDEFDEQGKRLEDMMQQVRMTKDTTVPVRVPRRS